MKEAPRAALRRPSPAKMRFGTFLAEILPLVGFHWLGLFAAAASSVGLGVMVMAVKWRTAKRVARFALFSALVSGGMTMAAFYWHAAVFLKVQPTLFNMRGRRNTAKSGSGDG